jgi:hypothetical protein
MSSQTPPSSSEPPAASNPAPVPRATSSSDGVISARTTRNAALVAAVAAILAAALALVGTLWSARVAAQAAIDSVSQQLSGETERSRAEFLRGQRQVMYTKMVKDESDLIAVELSYANSVDDIMEEGKSAADLDTSSDQFDRYFNTVQVNEYSLQLIGSPEMRDAYGRIVNAHGVLVVQLVEFGKALKSGKRPPNMADVIQQKVEPLNKAHLELTTIARADLGVK